MRISFLPEGIRFSISLAKIKWADVDGAPVPVKVGNEVSAEFYLMQDVEDCGRLVTLGERIDRAVQEAIELAEAKQAGG